jgi:hypothetical protein
MTGRANGVQLARRATGARRTQRGIIARKRDWTLCMASIGEAACFYADGDGDGNDEGDGANG